MSFCGKKTDRLLRKPDVELKYNFFDNFLKHIIWRRRKNIPITVTRYVWLYASFHDKGAHMCLVTIIGIFRALRLLL